MMGQVITQAVSLTGLGIIVVLFLIGPMIAERNRNTEHERFERNRRQILRHMHNAARRKGNP